MAYLRGIVTVLIIIVVVTSKLANGFMKLDSNRPLPLLKMKSIQQPLDHFNSSEKRTFKTWYYERLDFWKPNGPIYIYFGDFIWSDKKWISFDEGSLLCQMAKDTNGSLLLTEQRYSGFSLPNIQAHNNYTEYYNFLSSRQILADYANLIRSLKSDPKYKSSKVVVFGEGFMGNLAAWLRELHPDLVDAALAASAPVLAQKDFKEYYEGLTYIYGKYGSEKCLADIETYFKRIEKLLKTSDGIKILKKELNICQSSNLTKLVNQQLLFYFQYRELEGTYDNPSQIKDTCKKYEPKDMFTVDLFKRARSVPLRGCIYIDFDNDVPRIKDSWHYLSCTEYGQLTTTTSEKQPFVHWNPLEFRLKFCKGLFKTDIEKRIDEGVARTNKMYGGKHPNVTKVVFTHGDMDPWHALGVLQDLGPDAPAFIVNGTSRGAVLMVREDEPEEITKNRKYVKELIKKWISVS